MLTVVTDHIPLVYLQAQAVLCRRQNRWSEYLQMFAYKWRHRPGESNVADPLSRLLLSKLLLIMQVTAFVEEYKAMKAAATSALIAAYSST